MIYNKEKKEIILYKELNEIDKFVIEFTKLLDNYVIVSGYVAILLGRSRGTEDVDLLIPKMDEKEFEKLWENIHKKGFECINTSKMEDAFMMLEQHAIRFFKGIPIPNIEFKIIKNDLDKYSYENKLKILLNNGEIFVSPLELQIPYKLFLASEGIEKELRADKDIEDAKHLYKLFKENLNKEEFSIFINKLKVKEKLRLLE
jgi:hypothetical protein